MAILQKSPVSVDAWRVLDASIRGWWDGDVHVAGAAEVAQDLEGTLLYLPYPYTTPGGSEKAFPEIYGWDTYYVNCALLAHDRADVARQNILNQLYQIERYGMTLNGNRSWYATRSQPPLWAEGIRRYVEHTADGLLLVEAYRLLVKEYLGYWTAAHHSTPDGLTTNRDIGDTDAPALHAESETGLDFFPGFESDVRNCSPLITNCILVNFTRNLAWMASRLGEAAAADRWNALASQRAQRIREFCWDPDAGFYFEFNHVERRRIPVWSLNGFWALWAGVASRQQAARMVAELGRFLHPFGAATTDQCYPSPHPGFEWVQWNYPAGWPPLHVMLVEALRSAGHLNMAAEVAKRFLDLQVRLFQSTGSLWEKYNVVEGTLEFPMERYEVPPLHGWSSASVVLLGRMLPMESKPRRAGLSDL